MNVKVQALKDFPYFCFIFVNHMYAKFVDSRIHAIHYVPVQLIRFSLH